MGFSKFSLHKLLLTLLLFTITSEIYSESSYKKNLYNSFINREMYKWGNIIRTIDTGKSTTVDQKLELINYYYGYIGYLIGKKQNDIAGNMIPKGEKLIHQVLLVSPKNATALAFKGSFLGFRMGISKIKTFALSRESFADINRANALDPQNIQALIDKGNLLYYSPGILGGDKEEALKYYLKGSRLLEKNKETDQNWVYLNLLTTIALAYDKTDNPLQAKLICEKLLRKEPNYRWIKDVYYPKLIVKTR
jgi:tetratricopeptide (TPR) repeat protein